MSLMHTVVEHIGIFSLMYAEVSLQGLTELSCFGPVYGIDS
jgi:hypothetical protein